MSRGKTRDEDGRNLPDQQYPKELIRHACYRPRHRRRSSRRRWGHRPKYSKIRQTDFVSLNCNATRLESTWSRWIAGGEGAVTANLWEGSLGKDTIEINVSPYSVWNLQDDKSQHDRVEGRLTYIKRQVLPQAPSPTITSLRRISAIFLL